MEINFTILLEYFQVIFLERTMEFNFFFHSIKFFKDTGWDVSKHSNKITGTIKLIRIPCSKKEWEEDTFLNLTRCFP